MPKQLAQKLAETFDLSMVMLYDRQNDEIHRAGPANCEGIEEQLREAARQGISFQDAGCARVITAVRLGSDPIASIAMQGAAMPDSVLQGIANLVAIGLERARAQELARKMETTRQTERLRTALIDAMAHEFKTPLTSIKAATTSLLANPNYPEERRTQILKIADDEADHLRELIDDALEMARLEATDIDIQAQPSDLGEIVREVIAAWRASIDGRILEISADPQTPHVLLDRRLIKLAIKQLIDNALKYSPPDLPVQLRIEGSEEGVRLEITDRGPGIPKQEQQRIFQRFHRVPSSDSVPGLGLVLSIAQRIVESHRGNLTLTSERGRTTFRLTLPADQDRTPS
ncbi:MAG TPA: ATP-binding protein [Bryobacteraceae bacterium]|nr:ATP-binding protein [Bryobacteraceae bacterium]